MRMLRGLAIGLLLAAACDSKAKANDPAGGARPEQKSKEYESCGASLHCADNLRCVENTCQRVARSIVGDYHAAYARAATARGELEDAIAAYNTAVGQYGAEKIEVPPDIECGQGATLAAARATGENGNHGARVLHRCVLAAPVGSRMRDQALAHLASLSELGLDPLLLGGKQIDVYLTKGAARPATDKLAVTVTANPPVTGKGWAKIERLGVDLKPALIDCWVKHNNATKKPDLAGSVTVKVGFADNPDYEGEGAWYTKVEPEGADAACVHAAVEPVIKKLKLSEKIDSRVTFTIR